MDSHTYVWNVQGTSQIGDQNIWIPGLVSPHYKAMISCGSPCNEPGAPTFYVANY